MKKYFLTLLSLIISVSLYADVVYYKDGTKSEGKIIKLTKNIVIIREIIDGAQCDTEAPQSLVERIERGPLPKPKPVPREEVKKEPVVIPKEVSAPEPQVSSPGINEEPEQKEADLPEQALEKLPTSEQKVIVEQDLPKPEAQQEDIVREQVVKEKVAYKEKKEPLLIQEKELGHSTTKLCRYSLQKRENKTLVLSNKVVMHRVELSVIVPNDTTFPQLQNLFSYFLQKELRVNKKLDAFWVIAYRKAYSRDGIPMAYGIWAPPGGWDDFPHIQNKDQYQWQYRLIKRR